MGWWSDFKDNWCDAWEGIGDMFCEAGDSFAHGDILGGIGEGFLGVVGGAGNLVTGGIAGEIVDDIYDDKEWVDDGTGHMVIKDANFIDKAVMATKDNIENRNRLDKEIENAKTDEEKSELKWKRFGEAGKLVGTEVAATAAVVATVMTAGAAGSAIAGGASVASVATTVLGGSVGAIKTGAVIAGVSGVIQGVSTVAGGGSIGDGLKAGLKGTAGTAVFTCTGPIGYAVGTTKLFTSGMENSSKDAKLLAGLDTVDEIVKASKENGYIAEGKDKEFEEACNKYVMMALQQSGPFEQMEGLSQDEVMQTIEASLAADGVLSSKYYEDSIYDQLAESYEKGEVSANFVDTYAKMVGQRMTGNLTDDEFVAMSEAISLEPDNCEYYTMMTNIKSGNLTQERLEAAINEINETGMTKDTDLLKCITGNANPSVAYGGVNQQAGDTQQASGSNKQADSKQSGSNQTGKDLTGTTTPDTSGTADAAVHNTNIGMSNVYQQLAMVNHLDKDVDREAYFAEKYGVAFSEFKDALVAKKVEATLAARGRSDVLENSSAIFDSYNDIYDKTVQQLVEEGASKDQELMDFINGDLKTDVTEEATTVLEMFG